MIKDWIDWENGIQQELETFKAFMTNQETVDKLGAIKLKNKEKFELTKKRNGHWI